MNTFLFCMIFLVASAMENFRRKRFFGAVLSPEMSTDISPNFPRTEFENFIDFYKKMDNNNLLY